MSILQEKKIKGQKNTRINFKNNQTELLFKIKAIQWAWKGKTFQFGKLFSKFYVFKINFKKFRIKEKYRIKFKKSFHILFLQKHFGCLEVGENRAPPP